MPTFSWTVSPYTPFTKILSANVNQDKTDVQTFLNTTKLDDANIQVNGLTRNGSSSKLKSGTANYVLINDSSGNMSEEAQLALSRGGTGLNVVPGNQNSGDVLQINPGLTGFTVGAPTAVAASLRVYQFNSFA